jgi:hypothetical protein
LGYFSGQLSNQELAVKIVEEENPLRRLPIIISRFTC